MTVRDFRAMLDCLEHQGYELKIEIKDDENSMHRPINNVTTYINHPSTYYITNEVPR